MQPDRAETKSRGKPQVAASSSYQNETTSLPVCEGAVCLGCGLLHSCVSSALLQTAIHNGRKTCLPVGQNSLNFSTDHVYRSKALFARTSKHRTYPIPASTQYSESVKPSFTAQSVHPASTQVLRIQLDGSSVFHHAVFWLHENMHCRYHFQLPPARRRRLRKHGWRFSV